MPTGTWEIRVKPPNENSYIVNVTAGNYAQAKQIAERQNPGCTCYVGRQID